MPRHLSTGEKAFDVANLIFMILLMCLTLYPILYIFSMSISDPIHTVRSDVYFYPKGFSTHAYALVFKNPEIFTTYLNTIFYTTVGTVVILATTVCAAYPLSLRKFYPRRFFNALIVFTLIFNGGLVPTFLLINKLHLYNRRAVMIIPLAASAFFIIIARTYFETIPISMHESGKLDGANEVLILWKIILPLTKPVLAVVALFSAVDYWNSYFQALLYLPNPRLQPIQLYLYKVLTQASNALMSRQSGLGGGAQSLYTQQVKYAAIIIVITPILMIYPFLQRYFVKGVMIGAIKE